MRSISIAAALLGSTALTVTALAQSEGAQQQSQQQGACDRLIDELRGMAIDNRPVPMREARRLSTNGNTAECQKWLGQVSNASAQGKASQQTGNQQASGRSQITIRQQRPEVAIQRAQPDIVIQQQRPTITIDMPPPQVTVRMPEPDVNVVASSAGRDGGAQVTQAGQPRVQFEQAQPRVVVQQSNRSPQVRYEQGGQRQAQQQSQQQQRSGEATQQEQIRAVELVDMDVRDRRGRQVGYVNQIVQRNGQHYAIVTDDAEAGNPVHYRLALTDLALDPDQDEVVLRNMNRQQLIRQGERIGEQDRGQGLPSGAAVSIATVSDQTSAGTGQSSTDSGASSTQRSTGTGQQSRQTMQQQTVQTGVVDTTSSTGQQVRVSRLLEMSLYNNQGTLLGDVERVVQDNAGRISVVVGHGGFLSIGEKQVALPLNTASMKGDRLYVSGMTDAQINSMPEWQQTADTKELSDNQVVSIGR